MALDEQTRAAIDSLLREHPVVLFMKGTRAQPQCGFSAKTVAALDLLLPDYVTVNVLDYPQLREGIKEYGNWPTIPQLYVKGELIGGSDIVLDMLNSGELADALGVPKPEPVTPAIAISESAANAIHNAVREQPAASLRLQIDAGWGHRMSLEPEKPGDVSVESAGIRICMDPWTATRADGLRIDLEEDLGGTRFRFENPNAPPPVKQMSVQQLREKLARGEDLLLFDVRSDEERARATIEGARPFDQEAMRLIEGLPKDAELIFHCEMGGRSQQAAEHYRRLGYTNVHNLEGGIRAWLEEIENAQAQD
ncbi:MAG: Grx4 family monothiol glutaredoxin [Gammaproteobacteria bacterium]|nr:MAG: Grx4 family monothiol glutaredoxin [Gammaproteobacteria bacterium]